MLRPMIPLLACVLLVGCGTIHFDVPKGQRVKLLTKDVATTVSVDHVCWFALWGGIPLNENHSAPFIEEHRLVEVRLYNEQDFVDSICNTFTSILGFVRRTMIIEGNPSPDALSAPGPEIGTEGEEEAS